MFRILYVCYILKTFNKVYTSSGTELRNKVRIHCLAHYLTVTFMFWVCQSRPCWHYGLVRPSTPSRRSAEIAPPSSSSGSLTILINSVVIITIITIDIMISSSSSSSILDRHHDHQSSSSLPL
ncbi:hypothetical protein PoB_004768700 [Plakobranchus ocellatus]|uniref:Uncharacterized protein n=1 Tax=Plakobranchus ocellatus TaxID=259542 RepID=A0AAV4BQD5_9GAST|nr:hypothetical protein PoB_004768700 [Plakobranchus ocellatus]